MVESGSRRTHVTRKRNSGLCTIARATMPYEQSITLPTSLLYMTKSRSMLMPRRERYGSPGLSGFLRCSGVFGRWADYMAFIMLRWGETICCQDRRDGGVCKSRRGNVSSIRVWRRGRSIGVSWAREFRPERLRMWSNWAVDFGIWSFWVCDVVLKFAGIEQ